MTWVEVQVKTHAEFEEIISNIMYELGVKGLAIEDPKDILEFEQNESDWDFIDPELFDLESDNIIIKAYFPDGEDLEEKIRLVRENVEEKPLEDQGRSLGEVTTLEVYEKDWAEAWKKYYKPIKVGRNIIIKPTWEDYEGQEDQIIIELDPGMAFGTGTHETTILCLKALEKYVEDQDIVYDIGTGSGILSIAAAKLGASQVIGVDLDPVCVRVARENVQENQVSPLVQIEKGDLFQVIEGRADLIVSNIIAEVIVNMADSIKDYLRDGGVFIASGIVADKEEMVKESLEGQGFKILEINRMKDWVSVISRKE